MNYYVRAHKDERGGFFQDGIHIMKTHSIGLIWRLNDRRARVRGLLRETLRKAPDRFPNISAATLRHMWAEPEFEDSEGIFVPPLVGLLSCSYFEVGGTSSRTVDLNCR